MGTIPRGGMPGMSKMESLTPLRTHQQTARTQRPETTVTSQAVERGPSMFDKLRSKTQSTFSHKAIVDTDTQIANIEAKMQKLGVEPAKKLKSRWGILGKAMLNVVKSLPKALTAVTKGLLKLGSFMAQGIMLTGAAAFKGMEIMGKAMTGQSTDVDTEVFSKINKMMSGARDSLDKGFQRFDNWYDKKVGLAPTDTDTQQGTESAQSVSSEASQDGADTMVGVIDEVSGYYGTNILVSGDIGQTQDARAETTGGDGQLALEIGVVTNLAALGSDMSDIEGGMEKIGAGKELVKEGKALLRSADPQDRVRGEFKIKQGKKLIREGRVAMFSGSTSMAQTANGTVNLFTGSSLAATTNTGIANVTQVAGGAASAATNLVESGVEGMQARQAQVKINNCNKFLEATAEVSDSGQEVVATKNTGKVRDAVKAYKRNQVQTRNSKIFTSIAKFALGAAAVVGVALTIAAVASNPVGWAVGGAAIALGLGVAVYKGYKTLVKKDQVQVLQSQRDNVRQAQMKELESLQQDLQGMGSGDNIMHQRQGGTAIGPSIEAAERSIAKLQNDFNSMPPGKAKDKLGEQLQNAQKKVIKLRELQGLRKQISSTIQQTSESSAVGGLIRALNDQTDPDGQEAARVAFQHVFKMDPRLFMQDDEGQFLVGSEVQSQAMDQLNAKFNQFSASVWSDS